MPNKFEISNNAADDADCFVGVRVTDPLMFPDNVISQCTQCFHLIQHRPDVPKHLKMVCIVCAEPEMAKAAAAGELVIRATPRHSREYLQWLDAHKRH